MEKRAHKNRTKKKSNSHHRSFENNTAKNRVEGRVVRGRELPLGEVRSEGVWYISPLQWVE